jgi:hypothetical protein
MRTLSAGSVTPLLGSLGLHGCAVLLLALAARRPLELVSATHERADAWRSAVEVDAIATPDAMPTMPSTGAPPATAPAAEAVAAMEPASKPEREISTRAKPEPGDSPLAPRKTHRKRPRVEKAVTSDDSAVAAPEHAGTDSAGAQTATGAFGSQDLPPGVRNLPSAFTRAIPPATGSDPIWQTLPPGRQHAFTIALRVSADGHIEDSKVLGDHEAVALPAQFTHLSERVLALLGGGLFALQNQLGAGYGVFRITITLSDRAVKNEDDPAELVERGFDPPRGAQPGRAYFTLASGRHFEARVDVLNAQRVPRP